jgi:hypothetical protein
VGAKASLRVVKKRMTFAIYETSIMESVNGLEVLPTCYKKYQDVFEKKNANMLLQYRPYDCTIDLHGSTQLPFGPIYNLSQNELVTF